MTHQQKHLLRNAILLQLEAAHPASLPCETLANGINLAGFSIDNKSLLKELDYLIDKKYITSHPHRLNSASKRFKICATGLDYLDEHNLTLN